MPLYFAYGSNMNPAQMAARCPGSELIATASLPRYALAFAGQNRAWGGGVATLVRSAAAATPGLLYLLDEENLRRLDVFEGHPHVYQRHRRIVHVSDGRQLIAHVYSQPEARARCAPSDTYLAVIRDAYKRHGFKLAPLRAAVRSK